MNILYGFTSSLQGPKLSSCLSCCDSDLWKPEEKTEVPRTLGQDLIVPLRSKIIDIPFLNAEQRKLCVRIQCYHHHNSK